MAGFLSRFRALFRKGPLDEELSAEMQVHLELLAEDNLRRGMSPEEARYAAKRQFGGVEQIKEELRELRGLPFVEAFVQDMRFGLRMLVKNPGFTAVSVLTLALGIGATTAVFSVVDRILFRSLPYADEGRLVSFGVTAPIAPTEFMLGPDYIEWRRRGMAAFDNVTSWGGVADCDLTEPNPLRLGCAHVEASFLSTLGVRPILGRSFTREEDRPNAPGVALLSYGFWQSRFGGDPAVVGKSISLDGRLTLVVGVLPASFELPTLVAAEILVPQALDEATQHWPVTPELQMVVLSAYGRLKPGVSAAQAEAALQPLFQESLKYVPPQFRSEVRLRVHTMRDSQVRDSRLASWVLLGAVLAVLLVACANVANLLLARAVKRQRELAVRAALGASRARLALQALTECLLLSVAGCATGCALAYGLLHAFVFFAPQGIPRLEQARLDLRVLLFAVSVAIVVGAALSVAPTLRKPAAEFLVGRQGSVSGRGVLRRALVAVQIALSLVLLASAGLFLRSLWNLQNVSLGMDTDNVITASYVLGRERYPQPAQQAAFAEELEARLRGLPGVTVVALSDSIPPAERTRETIYSTLQVEGRPHFESGTGGMVTWRTVSPGYFAALAIPIVKGRPFRPEDQNPDQNGVILSDSLARRLFSGEDPVGKRIRHGQEGPWWTVVGVAGNVKNAGLSSDSEPEFYVPWPRSTGPGVPFGSVVLRSRLDRDAVAAWVRSEVTRLDPVLPVTIEMMNTRVSRLAARPRFNAMLLSIFAAMGVAMAAIGLYGVVAFLVARQTQEIGVRIALGATPRAIWKMVLVQAARWILAGAAAGLAGAFFVSRLLESLLFQVRSRDPVIFAGALALLIGVALVAAWVPARRAMRVDPVVALRYE